MIVKPQTDRVDQRQAATDFGAAAAISAASKPPKEWPTTAGAASLSASNNSP